MSQHRSGKGDRMTDEQVSSAHGLLEVFVGFFDAGQHQLAQDDFRTRASDA